MEANIWLSEIDDVVVNPGDLTMMLSSAWDGTNGAVVLQGDADERMAWLKKVAEAMECEVRPFTPEYGGPPCSWRQYIRPVFDEMVAAKDDAEIGQQVDEALFDILRRDQTIHWMGKPDA